MVTKCHHLNCAIFLKKIWLHNKHISLISIIVYNQCIMVINKVPYEDAEHIAFVQWIEVQHPKIEFIHIPNGELRDSNRQRAMIRGLKLKRMGVKKGVWDGFMPGIFTWLEMKRQKGGKLSPEQKAFRERREAEGYNCLVAYGWWDGKEKLEALLNKGLPCLKYS